jgi:hypothetical protein
MSLHKSKLNGLSDQLKQNFPDLNETDRRYILKTVEALHQDRQEKQKAGKTPSDPGVYSGRSFVP